MSIPTFNNSADVNEYLNDLPESQLLENSSLIYVTENSNRSNDLVNYIRYTNDITLEQLQAELEKLDKLMETASVLESVQLQELSMYKLVVESVIRRKTDIKCIATEHTMHFLENQLYDNTTDFNDDCNILYGLGNRSVINALKIEQRSDKISPKGIARLVHVICDPESPIYDTDKVDEVKSYLIQKLKCTMKYEMNHDEYKDIPVIHAIDCAKQYMKDMYHGFTDIESKLEQIFNEIESELEDDLRQYVEEEAIDAQFNPNPFNVYNLCPFPVGTRTLHRSLMNIATADTDEELDDAIMEYCRLENAYIHMVSEANGSAASKAVRKAGTVSNKVTSDIRTAADKVGEFRRDVHKIREPMIKFAEDTIHKIKDANDEERRNIIIKGGIMPRALRWLKRGIALVVIGSFGDVGAIIAVVSLLAMIATDATLDGRQRSKILRELEDELNIVEEKIDDARGDTNKQKKYELMRIRNKLKYDINRIKLRLRN